MGPCFRGMTEKAAMCSKLHVVVAGRSPLVRTLLEAAEHGPCFPAKVTRCHDSPPCCFYGLLCTPFLLLLATRVVAASSGVICRQVVCMVSPRMMLSMGLKLEDGSLCDSTL